MFSRATGLEYQSPRKVDFSTISDFKEQEKTAPVLVFVEGGTFKGTGSEMTYARMDQLLHFAARTVFYMDETSNQCMYLEY